MASLLHWICGGKMIRDNFDYTALIDSQKHYNIICNSQPRVYKALKRLSEATKIVPSGRTNLFKSLLHEMVFYFKVNDPKFDKHLGITRVHKIDKEKALELQKIYFTIFHPDAHIGEEESNHDDRINYNEVMSDIANTFSRVCGGLK